MSMNFDSETRNKSNDSENKRRLAEAVQAENERFKKVLDEFYAEPKRSKEQYAEINQKILETIDRLLTAGDWESSLFLRNAIKPLLKAKEDVLKLQKELAGKTSDALALPEQ